MQLILCWMFFLPSLITCPWLNRYHIHCCWCCCLLKADTWFWVVLGGRVCSTSSCKKYLNAKSGFWFIEFIQKTEEQLHVNYLTNKPKWKLGSSLFSEVPYSHLTLPAFCWGLLERNHKLQLPLTASLLSAVPLEQRLVLSHINLLILLDKRFWSVDLDLITYFTTWTDHSAYPMWLTCW